MSFLNCDLYDLLHHTPLFSRMERNTQAGTTAALFAACRESVLHCGLCLDFEPDDIDEMLFLALADYLTLVSGDIAELARQGEQRYALLEQQTGRVIADLPDEQRAYIKGFFLAYGSAGFDMQKPRDTVTLLCLAHHAAEAGLCASQKAPDSGEVMLRVCRLCHKDRYIRMAELLAE